MGVEKLFFDALGVNIKIDDNEYFEQLREFAGLLTMYLQEAPKREGRSNNSYKSCFIWENERYTIFLNHTGFVKGMGIFLEVKGYSGCKRIAAFINSLDKVWKWSMTRADVALDFKGKVFESLKEKLVGYARQKNITHLNTQGDWINCVKGRTLYAGSKKSEIQFRLYEKSEEQWEKGNKLYPPNMVRMEVQIRLTKRQRAHVTELTPLNVLSVNRNVSEFYGSLISTAIEPTYIPKTPEKTDLEKINLAIDQYYSIITRLISDVGLVGLLKIFIKRLKLNDAKSKRT